MDANAKPTLTKASKIPKRSFINRNLITIVMVPTLIGIHYGWLLLQDNKSLVKDDERIELPIVTASKYLWKEIQGIAGDTTATSTNQK